MSTKRTTTRTNARNEDRYLVAVKRKSKDSLLSFFTYTTSSIARARRIWRNHKTKRIYKLVGSGRGVK